MKRKTLYLFACFLLPLAVRAQPTALVRIGQANTYSGGALQDFSSMKIRLPESVVGSLPSASASTNRVYVVTDGTSASDCTTGGGSTRALCISNGTSWVALGGGGGGGATIPSVTNLIKGDGAGNGADAGFAASDVVRKSQANTYSGGGLQDMSAMDLKIPVHASDPGSCAAGQIEFNSSGTVMKVCTGSGTWVTLASGSGCTSAGAAGTVQAADGSGGCETTPLVLNADASLVASKAIHLPTPSAPTYNGGGTTTCNWALSNACSFTINHTAGATTLALTNPHGFGPYYIIPTQDSTGLVNAITYPGSVLVAPQPSSVASKTTVIICSYDGSANYMCGTLTTNDTKFNLTGPETSLPSAPTTGSGEAGISLDSTRHTAVLQRDGDSLKRIMPRTAGSTDQLACGDLSDSGTGCSGTTGAGGGVTSVVANYTLLAGDDTKLVLFNGSSLTGTLPSPPPALTWSAKIENLNASALTISRNGLQINGGTSNLTLQQYQQVKCYTDGTNYFCDTPFVAGSNITITPAANGYTVAVSGTLPVGNGGTGLTGGTANKVFGGATPSMVTVSSGYVDGSIANQTSGAQTTLTDGATVTWAIGSVWQANAALTFTTHGGSRTLNITGPVAAGTYFLKLIQDSTGGEGLTLGTGCTWLVSGGGAGAITLSSGANAVDVLAFYYDGTSCLANLNRNFN